MFSKHFPPAIVKGDTTTDYNLKPLIFESMSNRCQCVIIIIPSRDEIQNQNLFGIYELK